jgi:hypothetical protein
VPFSGDLLSAKGLSLILLAFFVPPAIYLLVLGVINRRRSPLLVSGVWDGVGLVFAVSGFLFFTGPAVFSSLSERWRLYWLLGQDRPPAAGPDGAWRFWIFLSILYFVLVVGGVALYFWRQRHLTAIYNVEAAQVEQAVTHICEKLGLNPVRSGNLFLFGLTLGVTAGRRGANSEKIQAPHYLPEASREQVETVPELGPEALAPDGTFLEQTAILELDSFALMRHVTLRWDPADSPLRSVVESELAHRLAEAPQAESAVGGWMLTFGCLLLGLAFLAAFVLILFNLLHR